MEVARRPYRIKREEDIKKGIEAKEADPKNTEAGGAKTVAIIECSSLFQAEAENSSGRFGENRVGDSVEP